MNPNRIIRILAEHSVSHFAIGGRIMADEGLSGPTRWIDITDWKFSKLWAWLGY